MAPYGTHEAYPTVAPATYPNEAHLSDSDRESLQEARKELQEAEANCAHSASSSEREELEEAREEYREELEEAYD